MERKIATRADGLEQFCANKAEVNDGHTAGHLQAKLLGLRLRMRKFITYV